MTWNILDPNDGEISDDELDEVAGGGSWPPDPGRK